MKFKKCLIKGSILNKQTRLRFISFNKTIILIGFISFLSSTIFACPKEDAEENEPSNLLKEFCIEAAADTKENCECGQATANEIMSVEEQATALALMQGDSSARNSLKNNHDEFMEKLSKVSKGCKNNNSADM